MHLMGFVSLMKNDLVNGGEMQKKRMAVWMEWEVRDILGKFVGESRFKRYERTAIY